MHNALELRVFTLSFKNVQALKHRKTCRAHRRKHTRKTGNIFGLDTRTNLNLDFGRFLFKARDDQSTTEQEGFGFRLILRFERTFKAVAL